MRELDMRLASAKQGEDVPSSCSFFVVGPPHSGKTNLLRYKLS